MLPFNQLFQAIQDTIFVLFSTQQGEFLGIAPTGRHVTVGLIDIMRLVDGKVVEHWNIGDDLSMLQQLGVIPSIH